MERSSAAAASDEVSAQGSLTGSDDLHAANIARPRSPLLARRGSPSIIGSTERFSNGYFPIITSPEAIQPWYAILLREVIGTRSVKAGTSTATQEYTSAESAFWLRLPDSAGWWLSLYFFFNLGLTLLNKNMLNNFPFPYSMTAVQALSGFAGSHIALDRGVFVPARLSTQETTIITAFSCLYTINIAVSSSSMGLVSLPFHQVVRASTPLFVILLSIPLLGSKPSSMKLLSLLPVVIGVIFATYGDYSFTTMGLVLTLFGTFLAALKTVVTNVIQTRGGARLKLHPLDLLMRMSPLAFIQCVIYGWWSGELGRVHRYGAKQMTRTQAVVLVINGIMAFGLNIVSFSANKKTSPLTMTVAANCKQVLTIIFAIFLFKNKNNQVNVTNAIGITLTLVGGAWYGWLEFQEGQKRRSGKMRAGA